MTSPPTGQDAGAVLYALAAVVIAALVAALLVFGR